MISQGRAAPLEKASNRGLNDRRTLGLLASLKEIGLVAGSGGSHKPVSFAVTLL
jgi:hypothetical protein